MYFVQWQRVSAQRARRRALSSGLEMTRRQFFGRTAKGIGVAALASLLRCSRHMSA